MKRWVPLDFFEKNKTRMYGSEKRCLELEGSAISFNEEEININEASIIDGKIVLDQAKKTIEDKKKASKEKEALKLKEKAQKKLTKDYFLDLLIEGDEMKIQKFREDFKALEKKFK